jgi:ABC-type multidrug transport system ATPase subunit
MPTVLRFAAVSKRYRWGAPAVLHDVTLTVQQGEVVHVAGANGSGKTTLLRIAAGVLRPTSGTVARASGLSWSPGPPIGGGSLDARALLGAVARVRRMPSWSVGALIDLLELGPHADEPLGTRSVGTRRKVNVACALLVPDPAVLVLDEPWGGLDERSGLALVEELRRRTTEGSTVIYTDHGEAPATPAGTRHVRIASGTIAGSEATSVTVRIEAVRDGATKRWSVPAGGVDALLVELLDTGWSIMKVERP